MILKLDDDGHNQFAAVFEELSKAAIRHGAGSGAWSFDLDGRHWVRGFEGPPPRKPGAQTMMVLPFEERAQRETLRAVKDGMAVELTRRFDPSQGWAIDEPDQYSARAIDSDGTAYQLDAPMAMEALRSLTLPETISNFAPRRNARMVLDQMFSKRAPNHVSSDRNPNQRF